MNDEFGHQQQDNRDILESDHTLHSYTDTMKSIHFQMLAQFWHWMPTPALIKVWPWLTTVTRLASHNAKKNLLEPFELNAFTACMILMDLNNLYTPQPQCQMSILANICMVKYTYIHIANASFIGGTIEQISNSFLSLLPHAPMTIGACALLCWLRLL